MQGHVRIMDRVSVFLGKMCGVYYLTAIALSVFEVFMRYALNAPTSWTSEIIMALVATSWLVCVGAVTQQRRHITATTMELLVGARAWRRMQKLAIGISMIAVAGLAFALWEPMIKVIERPRTSGSAFDPHTPTYAKVLIFFAALLYLAQLLANLLTPAPPAPQTPEKAG